MSCYACEKMETSREHAPPLCIFPQSKDTNGEDFRKNLITVPACDEHNLRKSTDDEYLMMVLAAHFSNNNLANTQVQTKIKRTWLRRPHLATMAVVNPQTAFINGIETMSFKVDLTRFNRSMELIARAVTFHEHQFKWKSTGHVWSPSMLPSKVGTSNNAILTSNFLIETTSLVFNGKTFFGSNPEVFKYRMHIPENPENVGLVQLVFYEGFNVCVLFSNEQ